MEINDLTPSSYLIRRLQRREQGVGAVPAVRRERGRRVPPRHVEPAPRDGGLRGAPSRRPGRQPAVGRPPSAAPRAGQHIVRKPALSDGARDAEVVVVRGGIRRRGHATRRAENI